MNFKSKKVIQDFGDEWARFPQDHIQPELRNVYIDYFSIVPKEKISRKSVCLDVGCGSGRWSKFVAPKVKKIFCLDPSINALNVAKRNLSEYSNCTFLNNSADSINLEDNSIDFAYSLGVLHHVDNTEECLKEIFNKLKPGSPFLIYLYYRFDNRSFIYRSIWKLSDIVRKIISVMPFRVKKVVTDLLALLLYLPLARASYLLELIKINSKWLPLSYYKDKSFYTMRTDSLDRFGTSLEKRYTKNEIKNLLSTSGFEKICFSEKRPYWVALSYKPIH